MIEFSQIMREPLNAGSDFRLLVHIFKTNNQNYNAALCANKTGKQQLHYPSLTLESCFKVSFFNYVVREKDFYTELY